MRSRLQTLLVVLTIVLLPSSARWVLVPDPEVYYAVGIALSDIPMAALIALVLPGLIARRGEARARPLAVLYLALLALVVISFALHPSAQGVQTLFRLVGAAALAIALLEARDERSRRLIVFSLVVMSAVQTALAAAQVATGDLLVPFEHPPLRHYGPFIRVNGTFPDSFVLAGYGLVVAALLAREVLSRPARGAIALFVAIAAAPVGFTFSRAAAVGAILAGLALGPGALRGARGRRLALAAIVLGVGLPGLVALEGWLARDEDSSLGNSANLRVLVITQTFPLLASDPVFGLGPGNTMTALRRREADHPGSVELMQPPHDVPYLVALEAGIPAGLLASAVVVVLGLAAWRRGDASVLAYVTLVPYLVLDNFPWTAAAGLPLVALWASGVLAAEREATG